MNISTTKPVLQEFKNAVHMFILPIDDPKTSILQFSPGKLLKKQSQQSASNFRLSPLSRHFKQPLMSMNKSKPSMSGVGVTVDDSGHFLIAEWKESQIDGRYFLFKPNLIEDQSNSYSSICQYGFMKSGNLHGDNYIYNIMGTIAKASFQGNQITGKSYVILNNKLFFNDQVGKMQQVQCEITNFAGREEDAKGLTNLKIPKLSSISNNQAAGSLQANIELVEASRFKKSNKFLEQLVRDHKGKCNGSLAFININEYQYFIGFQYSEKKELAKPDQIDGFGVILKNHWPSSYGTYKNGKLEGLGVYYQGQMNVYDGFFIEGQLMEGFIIDYYSKKIQFGYHSRIDPDYKQKSSQEQGFIVTDSFPAISCERVLEYKKNFHLKSLNFNNSYFNSPKLIHRSPWPYHIIHKLNRKTHMQAIIKSFRPTLKDMDISFIEKKGLSTQNRFQKQLIKQIKESSRGNQESKSKSRLTKQKSQLIKNEIVKNLKEKQEKEEENNRKKVLSKYVKQYKNIEQQKQQLIKPKKQRQKYKIDIPLRTNFPANNKTNSSHSNDMILTPRKKIPQTPQPKAETLQNLTYLVNQYNICQTERKMEASGNTTRRNTDRRLSPREIYSKRSLIQEDHQRFYHKQPLKTIERIPSARRKVNLDLIYQEFLHK